MTARGASRPFLTALFVLCASCASSGGGGGGGGGDVLTQEELLATNETEVYSALQRLRPTWLRVRGQTSFAGTTTVTVFVDGSPRGEASELRAMPITDVVEVRYLAPSDAAFQFGTLAGSGGTISIRTR
jgi:hypothetical protein